MPRTIFHAKSIARAAIELEVSVIFACKRSTLNYAYSLGLVELQQTRDFHWHDSRAQQSAGSIGNILQP